MSEELNKYNVNFPAESKVGTVDCSTKTVHNHYYGKAKSIKQRAVYIFLVSLTVILVTAGITLKRTSQKTSQKLIRDFEPIPININMGDAVLKGVNYYTNKAYYNALIEFDSSKDTSDFVMFYKANCYLYLKHFSKARECLNSIDRDNRVFSEAIEWLFALSFYYEEEMREAKIRLTDISTKESAYQLKAEEILKEIYDN